MKQIGISGYTRNKGIAILMEQPYPGRGGRHRRTQSYGQSPDFSLSPRQALRAESVISGATAIDINIDEIQSDLSSFLKLIQEGNILVLLQDDRPIAEIKLIK